MLLCLGPLPASKLVDFGRQRGPENAPHGPGPPLTTLRLSYFSTAPGLGRMIFIRKNVCAALKLEVNDPVIMQQIRLSLDGLAGLGCCYV